MENLTNIQGHIVLFCKNHYKYTDFFQAIRMLWCIRCGYDFEDYNKSSDAYIANELYKIFKLLNPKKADYFYEILHGNIANTYKYEGLTPIETLILEYRSEIIMIQVKEKVGKKWKTLVKLPKPKKRLFNRIFRGNGRYEDYKNL